MEFPFDINNILGSEISCVDKSLQPHRSNGREYRSQLCRIVDQMGVASAKAQALAGPITTSSRLQMSTHSLYVLKDAQANNGSGAVIGFIKVGHKRLFVYDSHSTQHEMEPKCALDFYVHESRQRAGCGHMLFEAMLQEEGLKPHQIAIDRPSHKFLSFLLKHYGLKATVKQVNNFVVFDGFFHDKPANAVVDHRRYRPGLPPYRNHGAEVQKVATVTPQATPAQPQPLSEQQRDMLGSVPIPQNSRPSSGVRTQDGGQYTKAMRAQGSMYSRHGNMTPTVLESVSSRQGSAASSGGNNNLEKLSTIDVSKKLIGGRDPPLLGRNGPSADYVRLLGRPNQPRATGSPLNPPLVKPGLAEYPMSSPVSSAMVASAYSKDPSLRQKTLNSAWNVFGVPPNPRTVSSPTRQNNRLW